MKRHIIIRGTSNGGKTTTCGVLYEELKINAEFSKLYTSKWKPIDDLKYNQKNNNLFDFISILVINGIVIIIISQGDVASGLEKNLEKLEDFEFVKSITNNRKIDFIVCCARSQMRVNSTFEMLNKRIPQTYRKEFWVSQKTKDRNNAKESKKALVSEIIQYMETE